MKNKVITICELVVSEIYSKYIHSYCFTSLSQNQCLFRSLQNLRVWTFGSGIPNLEFSRYLLACSSHLKIQIYYWYSYIIIANQKLRNTKYISLFQLWLLEIYPIFHYCCMYAISLSIINNGKRYTKSKFGQILKLSIRISVKKLNKYYANLYFQ